MLFETKNQMPFKDMGPNHLVLAMLPMANFYLHFSLNNAILSKKKLEAMPLALPLATLPRPDIWAIMYATLGIRKKFENWLKYFWH